MGLLVSLFFVVDGFDVNSAMRSQAPDLHETFWIKPFSPTKSKFHHIHVHVFSFKFVLD